ncbi:MAG TPA: hypothetical protein VFD58_19385 [Blastocatellia bacterium]|nr:hypothetical protein [Blastocatellia bacterium]
MNCQEFEKITADLSRERMMDAGVRADGLGHAAACKGCAARLADEQSLTRGLRALAATTGSGEAPAHVETALRAAFRGQAAREQVAVEQFATARTAFVGDGPQLAVRAIRQLPPSWRWWVAAAAILILAAMIVPRLMQAPSPKKDEHIAEAPAPPVTPGQNKQNDSPAPQPVRNDESLPGVTENPGFQKASSGNGIRRNSIPPRHRPALARNDRNTPSPTPTVDEVYSDFIPLGSGDQIPMESGHLMRVRMPRSVLPTFGLPMNVERANEPIRAEVLVGDDGMARAIRFANYVPGRTPR